MAVAFTPAINSGSLLNNKIHPLGLDTRQLQQQQQLRAKSMYALSSSYKSVEITSHQDILNKCHGNGTRTSPRKKKLNRAQIEHYKLSQELKNLKKSNVRQGAKLAEERLDQALLEASTACSALPATDASQNQAPSTLIDYKEIITDVTFNIVILGYAHQARFDPTAPLHAERVLEKFKASPYASTSPPTTFTYNAVIQAWAHSRLGLRAYHATVRMLHEMQLEYGLHPTTFTFNLIMESYIPKCQEWYQIMQSNLHPGVQPDRQTYHVLFKSYGQTGNVAQAEALVAELTERADQGEEELRPHAVWINSVISAIAKDVTTILSSSSSSTTTTTCSTNTTTAVNRGNRADWWLNRMQRLFQLGQINMKPDASTFSQVMNVHAILGNTRRVEELLQELERRFVATGDPQLQPDTVTYTTAIKAYVKQPEQCLRLLRIMHDKAAMGQTNVAPNVVTYNSVIRSFASKPTRDNLMTATQIMESMTVPPNSATYAELIFGWSASGLREAGHRAQKLLQELETLPSAKQNGVEFIKLYNAVILAWGRAGTTDAAKRADDILRDLEVRYQNGDARASPNIVTYVSVADAYAKACLPDAEQKCEALLQRMQVLREAGLNKLNPNRVLYNSILNALAKSSQPSAIPKAEDLIAMMQESQECCPDIVTYATLIDCYTKCSVGDSSDRADEILQHVEESYANGNQNSLLQPNAVFYSAILQAYAKTATPQGARKAEALLRRNERLYHSGGSNYTHCKPHGILFNAVIDAVARSGLPDSGQHAEALLQEMEDKYQAGDDSFRVTRRSLNAVLLAYRNDVHGGQKAEYILRRMEELTNAGVYDVMPDVIAWNTAIGAIAHSHDPTAAERAQAMLDRMEDLYIKNKKSVGGGKDVVLVRPDGITYSYVMEAWLKRNDEKGFIMAKKLLDKFFSKVKRTDSSADPVWNVIKAYRNERIDDSLVLEV